MLSAAGRAWRTRRSLPGKSIALMTSTSSSATGDRWTTAPWRSGLRRFAIAAVYRDPRACRTATRAQTVAGLDISTDATTHAPGWHSDDSAASRAASPLVREDQLRSAAFVEVLARLVRTVVAFGEPTHARVALAARCAAWLCHIVVLQSAHDLHISRVAQPLGHVSTRHDACGNPLACSVRCRSARRRHADARARWCATPSR